MNITIFLNTTPQKYNIINIFPNILTAATYKQIGESVPGNTLILTKVKY